MTLTSGGGDLPKHLPRHQLLGPPQALPLGTHILLDQIRRLCRQLAGRAPVPGARQQGEIPQRERRTIASEAHLQLDHPAPAMAPRMSTAETAPRTFADLQGVPAQACSLAHHVAVLRTSFLLVGFHRLNGASFGI
jgi:hypothetical protein